MFPGMKRPLHVGDVFPDLPVANGNMTAGLFGPLSLKEHQFVLQLSADDPSSIEKNTQGQSNNPLWHNIRKNRLTSSNFGLE